MFKILRFSKVKKEVLLRERNMFKSAEVLYMKEREKSFDDMRDMSFMTYYECKAVTIIVKRYV